MKPLIFVDGMDDHLPPLPRWRGGPNGYVSQFDDWVRTSGWTYDAVVRIPEFGKWIFAIEATLSVYTTLKGSKPVKWSVSLKMGHNVKIVGSGPCRTLKDARDQADQVLTEEVIDGFVADLYHDRSATTCLYRYTGGPVKIPYDRVREITDDRYSSQMDRWEAARNSFYADILQPQLWEPYLSYLGVIKYRELGLLPGGRYLEVKPEGEVGLIECGWVSESTSYNPQVSRFGRSLTYWAPIPEDLQLEQP